MLCKKGFKAVLESDKIILSKNGLFVGKGYSYDGMFKLSIINKNFDVSIYMIELSLSLWYDHLAHVSFRSLKYMSKHGLISYKNDDKRLCEICFQAKMFKQHFSKVERNSKLLDLVHSDICELNGILTRGGKQSLSCCMYHHAISEFQRTLKRKEHSSIHNSFHFHH